MLNTTKHYLILSYIYNYVKKKNKGKIGFDLLI